MSSVRRSEKQTLHFGHCHLLHFSTTHTSPFLKLAQPRVPKRTPPPRNFHSNNPPERLRVEETWQNTNETPSWLGNKQQALEERRRDTIGRKYSQNAALATIAQRKNYLFAWCNTG